jgi:hypothetical protein
MFSSYGLLRVRLLTASSYSDDEYEYRHVQLPKAMLKAIPAVYHDKAKGTLKLLWEDEWRGIGITQVGFLPATRLCGMDSNR